MAEGAILPAPAVPASTRISARLKRVRNTVHPQKYLYRTQPPAVQSCCLRVGGAALPLAPDQISFISAVSLQVHNNSTFWIIRLYWKEIEVSNFETCRNDSGIWEWPTRLLLPRPRSLLLRVRVAGVRHAREAGYMVRARPRVITALQCFILYIVCKVSSYIIIECPYCLVLYMQSVLIM